MTELAKSFYLTTPIYYVNDAPHIGHAYTTTAGDVLTRWHRQRGESVWFLTGVDEHGTKVQRAAEAGGVEPQVWVDRLVSESWQPVLGTIDARNDDFIRTTETRHVERVQKFWDTVKANGYVFSAPYEGPYCVGCEEFKFAADLVEGNGEFAGEQVCSIHGKPPEQLSEENWFFQLSAFNEQLIKHYEDNPNAVRPQSAYNEVMSFLRGGLVDISMSRSSVKWGIPLSWDTSQVVYVWFDALLNYITATGYGAEPGSEDAELFTRVWPANVQLVGKDILRFHAVYWPAMLMAAGLKPPQQVFAHGWLLVGGEKMSKSKLTGISPELIVDHFGSDAFRYYFMGAIAFGHDGSFSWEDMSARYTSELANGLGNLASRVTAMVGKYFEGKLPADQAPGDKEVEIQHLLQTVVEQADSCINDLDFAGAIGHVRGLIEHINGYVTEQEPWVLAKHESTVPRLATVLYTVCESLRAIAVLYNPVMPKAMQQMWQAIGAEEALGNLADQPLGDCGTWGHLPAGVQVTKENRYFLDSSIPKALSFHMSTATDWPHPPLPLEGTVIDSHTHLDVHDRNLHGLEIPDPRELLDRARSVGVDRVVQVGCDLESSEWAIGAARKYSEVIATVGLHPNEAPRRATAGDLDSALARIAELATDPAVRGIGETGLDYFRTDESGREAQHRSFRWHIDLAREVNKTLVIHDRDSHADVLSVLIDQGAPAKVVFHCFSGDATMARVCAENGWYMSFAGVVTFKNAESLREALDQVPDQLLLVETDAPYLTPTPNRGRVNASYLMPYTVRAIAERRGIPELELCTILSDNAINAFGNW